MRPLFPMLLSSLALASLGLLAARGAPSAPLDPRAQQELSADLSLGKVIDREGVASARAATEERWRSADENLPLFAGTSVKTGARGANALHVRLRSGATLLLGPGALVELTDAKGVHVQRGEVEIGASEAAPLRVSGPGGAAIELAARRVVRARDGKLAALDDDPRWLAGYRSGRSTEALGSLLANVDGREVPLTLGYHKVTVDVRDQIARTVVEESFVNHTDHVLEGVFYFPLPGDASISSFGMWIGDELVEGDIVEKERARAIYEQILREKRDPGLLEWAGGSIFKARVYPIAGEKRIKLSYTQVLPKEGDVYAYHYALQSELLKLHPLRQLAIEVHVSSAEPLAAVASPSHDCRVQATEHGARVSFDAEEYVPDRDFELRIRTKSPGEGGAAGGLTFVADRRGGEGYFLLRFSAPPAAAARGDARGAPTDWLVLADTSGSMNGPARATQIAFVEALLQSLSDRDTFQLATCDVETRFAFTQPVPNRDENRAPALDFLERRDALGWSDLDSAFGAAFAAANASTHIVYVGDGQPTLGDADPGAFAQRLPALHREHGGRGRVHAVVPGTTAEPIVLRALSRLGHGSLRSIGGGSDPSQTAEALVLEATSPRVTELAVAFDGISVAAVHPETLPNLPAGRQQIVVGRFDPGAGARGRVRVTGRLDGAPIEQSVAHDLGGGGETQSFIPRLWARHHLDHLLAAGASRESRDRVIALSEEFQIATPYTSFLVLESDADRERFRVEKRMRMRDGEEFFAKGREDANFALLREQIRKAGLWHRGLRADVLAALSSMGREATELLRPSSRWYGGVSESLAYGFESRRSGGQWGARGGGKLASAHGPRGEDPRSDSGSFDGQLPPDASRLRSRLGDSDEEMPGDDRREGLDADAFGEEQELVERDDLPMEPAASPPPLAAKSAGEAADRMSFDRKRQERAAGPARRNLGLAGSLEEFNARDVGGPIEGGLPVPELDQLFPALPLQGGGPGMPAWPPDVIELLRRLDRRAAIAASRGGLRLHTSGTSIDRRNRARPVGRAEWLLSRADWLFAAHHRAGEGYEVQWLRGEERGAWRADWMLGRARRREPGDERGWPAPFAWGFGDELASHRDWTATLLDAGDGTVEIRLTSPHDPLHVVALRIDRARAVLLAQVTTGRDGFSWTTRWSEFVDVAGASWPTKVENLDRSGRLQATLRLAVEELDDVAFAARLESALAQRGRVIELGRPPADLAEARQAVADGRARLDDHWLLLRAALARGEAGMAEAPLAALRTLASDRPGLERIELAVLARSRRQEELRRRLLASAARLEASPHECEVTRLFDLLGLASRLDQGHERLELLGALEPVVRRQTETWEAGFNFDQQVAGALAAANRAEELFAAQERLARDWPDQASAHTGFASVLAARGDVDDALARLDAAERDHGPWEPHEIESFFSTRLSILWNGYRLEALLAAVEARTRESAEQANSWQLDQYLSAVVMLDRETQWWTTIEQWLGAARDKIAAGQPLSAVERARVEAAIRQAIGQGWSCWWHDRRYEPREAGFLAGVARVLLDDEQTWSYAQQIVAHGSFRQTPPARALLADLYARVEREAATRPARALAREIQVLRAAQFAAESGEPGWQRILDVVLARFVAAAEPIERNELEGVLTSHGRRDLVLGVLRHRLEIAGDDDDRGAAAHALLAYVMQDAWSEALEAECLRLLPIVRAAGVTPRRHLPEGDAAAHGERTEADLRARIVAWYDFVNWAVEARAAAAVAALPDVNLLPRRKLAIARQEQIKLARAAVRDRLAQQLALPTAPGPVEWLKLDRAWLSVLLRQDEEAARADALALLRDVVEATNGRDADRLLPRERILAARGAATLLHLLARAGDDGRDARERELLAVTDAAQAAGHPLLDWRQLDFERLVALDRGDALEANLAGWFGGGERFAQQRYGRMLAWIRAERGKLDEAARVMEQVATIDELSHLDWLALSDWYTALDRRSDAARARLAAWGALDEHELSSRVNVARGAIRDRGDGVPAPLDPAVADQLVALLRKAQWPASHLWQLQNLYGATKEFRLLQCLPEAVIGHSAQGVYGFLGQLHSIQGMVDEEATVDRLVAHLDAVMERATTAVDRRALHLLRFLAQWKAATQRNGSGPHAEAALRSMRAAFDHPLATGEARPLAAFLAQLGAIADPTLRAEQLRQLAALVRAAAPGSEDRLALAAALATVQWHDRQREAALRTLSGELSARRFACGDRLPESANDALVLHGGWLQQVGDHLGCERILAGEHAVAGNAQRAFWLENLLHANHVAALRAGTRTSLGVGREIYAPAQRLFRERALARTNENQAGQFVQHLIQLWSTAHELKMAGVAEDAERFAFDDLPDVMANYQYRSGQSMVSGVSHALRQFAGPASAVEFLVARAENEPRWLVRVQQEFWNQHAWTLASWRHEAGRLDARLERRLLAITVKELRAEMRHARSRGHGLFDRRWSTFWSAKQRDFSEAAKAELAAGPDDEPVALRMADYLFRGLEQHDDAIAVLLERARGGRLSLDGRQTLCVYLQERRRWAESLPFLAGLIDRRPELLELRLMQMRGLHGTRQLDALEAARSAIDATWRERGLWHESVIASLAQVSFDTELWDASVAYFGEAIELHAKSAPNRGVGDGTLSTYYGQQARALAQLGRTAEAVDAAAGAVVSWGRRDDQRQQALAALEQVLMQAESLDEYVATLDAETARTGLENPIVRKALGKVWQRKGAWEKAAAQYKASLESAPHDVEARQSLVEVYDRMKRPELAISQLFASMESTGHDVALMRELGRRLTRLGAAERAERVHTNLAEMLPHESESHEALAQVREEQRRFADAADQWRQVVRVRTKEPTGYLGLAKALLAAGDRKSAREPLEKLLGGEWEARFGDVKTEARELLRRTAADD